MSTPRTCTDCGRPIRVKLHPGRSPHGKTGYRRLAEHDLCRQCFRTLMNRAKAAGA